MRLFPPAVACLVIISLSSASLAGETAETLDRSHPLGLPYYQPYGMYSEDYETPHVKWGKPLAGGAIRAMILAPQWTHRESVELAQRLDVRVTPWMCYNTKTLTVIKTDRAFAAYLVSEKLIRQLLDKYLAETFDVYVVGKIDWSILPPASRFELLKKVSEGAGLVLICQADHEELDIVLGKHPTKEAGSILRGVPWRSLPRLRNADGAKLVRTARYGRGRVVKLDYQQQTLPSRKGWIDRSSHSLTPHWVQASNAVMWPETEEPEQELAAYEYYQSLVGRAVRWAAGRGDRTSITVTIPDNISAQVPTDARLKTTPAGARVRLEVRDQFGKVVAAAARTGETIVLPALAGGDYMLDVWMTDNDNAVLDWGSWAMSVLPDNSIKAVTLDERMFEKGGRVRGTVTLSKAPARGDGLVVSLWDNLDRKIDEQSLSATGTSTRFDLGPLTPLTTMHQVRARLVRQGKAIAVKRHEFPVRMDRRLDDFTSVIWSEFDNSYPTWAMLRKLHDQDEADVIDGLVGLAWMGDPPAGTISREKKMNAYARNVARAGMLICPYNSRFGCLGAPKATHVVRADRNLLSKGMLAKVRKDFTVDARVYGPYGPYVWTHGDESMYSADPNVDWGKEALGRFRKEARHLYGTLDALNEEWKTSYAGWQQVMPLTFEDAKKSGNYAPWVVHRLSSDAVFAEFYKFAGDIVRAGDPGALTGFDGAQGLLKRPNSGGDWWRLAGKIQLFHSYRPLSHQLNMEVFRSFAPADTVRGMWYGTYGPSWCLGPNTIEYCHNFPWYSLFHSLNSSWFWYMGAPGPTSGYAGDMTSLAFMEARTQSLRQIKGGIGKLLLACRRRNDNIAVHFSESSKITESFYQKANNDWCRGYTDSVSTVARMLEDVGFQYDFVASEQIENGELTARRFKVLFMPHSRAISPREATMIRSFVRGGGVVFADIVPGRHNARGALLASGLLADIFPTAQTGTVTVSGAGKAVLYGADWNRYGPTHASPAKGWKKLDAKWKEMAGLLEKHAGIKPAVRINGGDIPPTEIARFDAGPAELVGLVRSYFLLDPNAYSATIDFGQEGYIYDVRRGVLLGEGSRIPVTLDYEAQLFAVCPYRVDAIAMDADTSGAIRLSLQTSGEGDPGMHVYRFTVAGPDGKEMPWYAQNILAPRGVATATIPFALNDPPGDYVVKARDVTSGITAEMRIAR